MLLSRFINLIGGELLECGSVEKIKAIFKREGYSFLKFSLKSEVRCHPSDSDWNYKDLVHVKYVHENVGTDYALIGDDYLAALAFQKVFGLKIPITIINYSKTFHSQIYQMSWLFFTLIVETSAKEYKPGWTRVTTDYNIGSPRIFSFLRPIVRWMLERNYNTLMAADIPMRERRGQLRSWGYRFNGEHPSHSFERSLDISVENVITPRENNNDHTSIELSVKEILPADGEYLHGRDDHLGVQIIRSGNMISVYPRLCPHEGASLDKKNFWVRSHRREIPMLGQKGYKIMCPWHGRLFEPFAAFELSSKEIQKVESDYWKISLKEGLLTLIPIKE